MTRERFRKIYREVRWWRGGKGADLEDPRPSITLPDFELVGKLLDERRYDMRSRLPMHQLVAALRNETGKIDGQDAYALYKECYRRSMQSGWLRKPLPLP